LCIILKTFLPDNILISKTLIAWYKVNHRDLPWRNTTNPYIVWVSEIILQQTQVAQGLPYFNRFVEQFPKVEELANAHEDQVLKLWQGLGYYSRARNLHFSAKYITEQLNGKFPTNYADIKQLKGVGDYTAAAIASFCYKEKVPVVDGNVLRFIARYYGITEPIDTTKTVKEIKAICQELISNVAPDDFNQAIMEFGSQVCKPSNPLCKECPLKESCWALANKQVDVLPYKEKKIKKRERFFYYLFIENNNNNTYIRKRDENDIWKGLYEFPLIEHQSKLSDELLHEKLNSLGLAFQKKSSYKKHLLSHQTLYACNVVCRPSKSFSKQHLKTQFTNLQEVNANHLEQFAFPKLLERLM